MNAPVAELITSAANARRPYPDASRNSIRGLPSASTVSVSRGLPAASDSDTVADLSGSLPANSRRGAGGASRGSRRSLSRFSAASAILFAAFSFSISSLSARVGTVPHLQTRRAVAVGFRIADADRLVLLELIEHHAGVGAAAAVDLASRERQAADLVPLLVEEQHPGDRPRPVDHLAVHHPGMHPVLVRDAPAAACRWHRRR